MAQAEDKVDRRVDDMTEEADAVGQSADEDDAAADEEAKRSGGTVTAGEDSAAPGNLGNGFTLIRRSPSARMGGGRFTRMGGAGMALSADGSLSKSASLRRRERRERRGRRAAISCQRSSSAVPTSESSTSVCEALANVCLPMVRSGLKSRIRVESRLGCASRSRASMMAQWVNDSERRWGQQRRSGSAKMSGRSTMLRCTRKPSSPPQMSRASGACRRIHS
mmetsp:Transcript_729/g.2278  ORF Transcript_729/g.2278 Transcript_729/m.2278 type:complete len:222 (+) Transcript_729:610-1275(+)